MSETRAEVRGDNLPEPRKRRCVLLGMAVVESDDQVKYRWKTIREQWRDHWHNASMNEFAAHYHIPYRTLRNQMGSSETDIKRRLLDGQAVRHWDRLREMAMLAEVDELADQAQRYRKTLESLERLSAAGIKFAELRLLKSREGRHEVNTAVPVSEVKSIMEIGYKAAEMMRAVIELGRGLPKDKDEVESVPTPRLKISTGAA